MAEQTEREHTYLCIDLKTFYASVECCDRGLDPFTTNLVVADPSRTEKTICLAVSPAMKALGVRNRCRVFEIPPHIDYIMARPRMQRYVERSADIYSIYLEFVSPEDIHPYSIDECFIDATPYLDLYGVSARAFASLLIDEVHRRTGISAAAGIGPNLFLAKVALDITAKHVRDNIGILDEESFRKQIWPHRPITDIWGIGPGIAARLAKYGVCDLMGVAALDEEILYRELGVNAEYLIDHAFGREPVTIAEIQAYRPAETSYVNGQVLSQDYTYEEGLLVLKERVDMSARAQVERGQGANHISLYVGYAGGRVASGNAEALPDTAAHGLSGAGAADVFIGEHGTRRRGAFAHGGASRKIPVHTNSHRKLLEYFEQLWCDTIDPACSIRRINIGLGNLIPEEFATTDLFSDAAADKREQQLAHAMLAVKGKFGKNALIRGMSLLDKATARERNEQVGGHHA